MTTILESSTESIRLAAQALRAGRLVAFPTETVYGLGADALDETAVHRIFTAKGRPAGNPLIVHVAEPSQVRTLVTDWTAAAEKLAAAFWPGPLTLVLPKQPTIPNLVSAGGPTLAIRCPAHPIAHALLKEAAVPIAAPSANRSGSLSPTTAAHVQASLDGRIDFILDGGPCSGGIESTVVDVRGPTIRLLRPGLISLNELRAVVPSVESFDPTPPSPGNALPSPGMLTRHYAPRTPLECAETDEEAETMTRIYEMAGLRVGRWTPRGSPGEVAAELYAAMHQLDQQGFDRILAVLPPDQEEWRAIRDRLRRASAE